MKPLSKTQLWIIGSMLVLGVAMIVTSLVAVVFISIGCTLIAMAVILLVLECGPSMWYWWIPFRMGHHIPIHHNDYSRFDDDIQLWLKENIKFRFMYTNHGEIYYFLRKTDAAGFKLRWI